MILIALVRWSRYHDVGMVGEACSRKGAFRPDRGEIHLGNDVLNNASLVKSDSYSYGKQGAFVNSVSTSSSPLIIRPSFHLASLTA